MEHGGFLTSKSQVVRGKRRTKYRITAGGRKVLRQAKKQVRELVSEVIDDKDLRAEAKRRRERRS